jgi:hypothetical protein
LWHTKPFHHAIVEELHGQTSPDDHAWIRAWEIKIPKVSWAESPLEYFIMRFGFTAWTRSEASWIKNTGILFARCRFLLRVKFNSKPSRVSGKISRTSRTSNCWKSQKQEF